MTAPITTEELRKMSECLRVFSHNDGLTLAAELITARAKLEAAEKLADMASLALSHAAMAASSPLRRPMLGRASSCA